MAGYSVPISTIKFSTEYMDYVIDGTPLLSKVQRHENMPGGRPSVACTAESTQRLTLKAKPDLRDKWTALYLCDHCWDYDGQIIGCHIFHHTDDLIVWSHIGYLDEFEDKWVPFTKIKEFRFKRSEYIEVIESAGRLKLYEH